MLSRMRNYSIDECEKNFDELEVYLKDSTTKTLEGEVIHIGYALQENAQRPSPLQIRRNYENAIKGIGGEILLSEDNHATFRIVKNGKETWVKLDVWNGGNDYDVYILEITAMEQEVTADAMYAALSKDGFIALYINFDTGKSEIKPEALGTIDQIATLMTGHPDLKIGIEGHTDNVGKPEKNKTLSEARAASVKQYLLSKGIEAARLDSAGFGDTKPAQDNKTAKGRAANRRIEFKISTK